MEVENLSVECPEPFTDLFSQLVTKTIRSYKPKVIPKFRLQVTKKVSKNSGSLHVFGVYNCKIDTVQVNFWPEAYVSMILGQQGQN
jgi:hypothetical protein